jgi:hypothetical protein
MAKTTATALIERPVDTVYTMVADHFFTTYRHIDPGVTHIEADGVTAEGALHGRLRRAINGGGEEVASVVVTGRRPRSHVQARATTLAHQDTLTWEFAPADGATLVTVAVDVEPLGPGLDILGEPAPGEAAPDAPVLLQRLRELITSTT